VGLGVAVFAGFSIYADVQELGDRMAGFHWWAFGAALALALLNYLVRFARWSLYLRGAEIALPRPLSLRIFLAGFALSVTPGKLGELIKSYFLREFEGVPISRSAPLVVAERVTDLAALLILGLIGVAAYGVARSMVLAGMAVVAAGLMVLAWPAVATAVIRVLTQPGPSRRFRRPLLDFYQNLATLVRPWPLCWATSVAVLAWLSECIGFAIILAAFPGTQVPIGLAVLIYAATTVAGALSFLPGGLLVTEATMALLLVQSSRGIDQPTAVAATILTRLATLWFAVVIGLIALAGLRRLSPAAQKALDAAESEAESAADEPDA
jgi:uncharacterized protein (TIRG00374 family)